MARPSSKVVWGGIITFCAILLAFSQVQGAREQPQAPASSALTCDAAQINPDSYALATRIQALIVTEDRSAWWERFSVAKAANDLRDLNWGSLYAAERAVEIDPHNLLAHAILARQDVVLGIDAARARQEWHAVLDNGGPASAISRAGTLCRSRSNPSRAARPPAAWAARVRFL